MTMTKKIMMTTRTMTKMEIEGVQKGRRHLSQCLCDQARSIGNVGGINGTNNDEVDDNSLRFGAPFIPPSILPSVTICSLVQLSVNRPNLTVYLTINLSAINAGGRMIDRSVLLLVIGVRKQSKGE